MLRPSPILLLPLEVTSRGDSQALSLEVSSSLHLPKASAKGVVYFNASLHRLDLSLVNFERLQTILHTGIEAVRANEGGDMRLKLEKYVSQLVSHKSLPRTFAALSKNCLVCRSWPTR